MNYRQLATEGLWTNNPALVQLLGLCPLLAVSNSFVTSLGLGLTTLIVLIAANMTISLVRGLLDESTRLPAQIMVIAGFVTLADLLLQAFFFEVHQRIGLFVALIVTNCTLLGRAEAFASRQPVRAATMDGAMMGAGFLLVILLMGSIREILGQGTLFANMHLIAGDAAADWTIRFADTGFLFILLPPGAFMTLGCIIALKNLIDMKQQDAATARELSHE
ncbi:MAG: electron transport complex subunit E [Pseudomonadota bacterium]